MKDYLARVAKAVAGVDMEELEHAVRILTEVRDKGNMVWLVGNGGSAATAEHFAVDLTKMAGVRAIAINSLLPSFLAYGNDHGWDRMFSDLLLALKKEEDVLVAISCSGRSDNVIHCARLFRRQKLITMTGNIYNSPLAIMEAGAWICVPDEDIRVQEDAHMAVCHAVAGRLR
jgi:D-sedoheptulose 7-phosphate isomerase